MFWYFILLTLYSGTGTFVLCETSITYNSLDIQDTNLDCKILNDNSLPPAQSSELTNLLQVVEFYENIGIVHKLHPHWPLFWLWQELRESQSLSVRPVKSCLEQSIFIYLGQRALRKQSENSQRVLWEHSESNQSIKIRVIQSELQNTASCFLSTEIDPL